MSHPLRATLVQADLIWENSTANLRHFDQLLQPILKGSTDLIILPEMFTTGFSMDAASLAQPMGGSAHQWMQEKANTLLTAITGSIICQTDQGYFNRLLFVRPHQPTIWYDKRHLFTLAGEHLAYQPGTDRLIAEWKGWRICPLICYDLRFPVWSRNTELYDLLIYVANWPDKRRNAWMTLLAARAIENQAYCIGVNRVGVDEKGHHYSGDTSMYDFAGNLGTQITRQEALVTLELDYEALHSFREKLNFLADRDHFLIQSSQKGDH